MSDTKTGPNNISESKMADLKTSWHIPRPTLARSSTSSQGSTSSKNSTQSTKSGTLLLTAANLAQIHESTTQRDSNLQLYLQQTSPNQTTGGAGVIPTFPSTYDKSSTTDKTQDLDNVSIASSMHFTVVNVNHRPRAKPRSCCSKHQLTILVITMSVLFLVGIISAIFFIEMRARRATYP